MEIKEIIKKLRKIDAECSKQIEYGIKKVLIAMDIGLHGDEIMEQIQQNPDSFFAIEHKYFADLSFIADMLEVADIRNRELVKDWVKKTIKDFSDDKEKLKHPDKYAKLDKKDMGKNQNDAFAYRVQLRLAKEVEDLKQDEKDRENSPEFQAELARVKEIKRLATEKIVEP